MPRNGSGVYSSPTGTHGAANTTIASAPYNANVDDVAQDLNTPRPIVAGGTGATNAAGACSNIGAVNKTGDTMTGNLALNSTDPRIVINKTSSGHAAAINGYTAGSARWDVTLGDTATESGGDAGSNFGIGRYSDSGSLLGTPLSIERANGRVTIAQNLHVNGGVPGDSVGVTVSGPSGSDAQLALVKPAAGVANKIIGSTGASMRWVMQPGDAAAESGGNAGSNFTLWGYNDASNSVTATLSLRRSDGQLTNSGAIVAGGALAAGNLGVHAGMPFALSQYTWASSLMSLTDTDTSAETTYPIIFYRPDRSTIVGHISTTLTGVSYNSVSDGRLKEDLQPINSGKLVDALKTYDFRWKKTGARDHGLVAQEAIETLPHAVTHDETNDTWAIDYSKLVPLLLAEIKSLRARVAALEDK